VLSATPEPGYVQYLATKLRPLITEKEARLALTPQSGIRDS
jgi:hypothetical protein